MAFLSILLDALDFFSMAENMPPGIGLFFLRLIILIGLIAGIWFLLNTGIRG